MQLFVSSFFSNVCLSLFLEIGKDLMRFYLEGTVHAGEKLVLYHRLDY